MPPELRCPAGHLNDRQAVFCTTCGAPLPGAGDEVDVTRINPGAFGGAPDGMSPTGTVYMPGTGVGPGGIPPTGTVYTPGNAGYGVPPVEPPRKSSGRKVWPIVVIAVLALLVVGLGTAVALTSSKSRSVDAVATTGTPATTSSTSTTVPPPTVAPSNVEQQQATVLQGLLQQSTSDRSQVVSAYDDIVNCGSSEGLSEDEQVMNQAQSSRQSLVNQLDTLSLGALPGGMITDLVNAWNASASADGYYAGWAADESSNINGCTDDDTSDSNFQAASSSDTTATDAKETFAGLWNPVAQQFNLTQYQASQL